tara:strand:- start:321 stop:641 length:321 start_codon:yes stop_codon:yes gene_type:complete
MNDNQHPNFNRNSLTISTLHNLNNMESMQITDSQLIIELKVENERLAKENEMLKDVRRYLLSETDTARVNLVTLKEDNEQLNEQIAELKTTIDAFQQFILKHNKKA